MAFSARHFCYDKTFCIKQNRDTLREHVINLECFHTFDKILCCKVILDLSKKVLYILPDQLTTNCEPSNYFVRLSARLPAFTLIFKVNSAGIDTQKFFQTLMAHKFAAT